MPAFAGRTVGGTVAARMRQPGRKAPLARAPAINPRQRSLSDGARNRCQRDSTQEPFGKPYAGSRVSFAPLTLPGMTVGRAARNPNAVVLAQASIHASCRQSYVWGEEEPCVDAGLRRQDVKGNGGRTYAAARAQGAPARAPAFHAFNRSRATKRSARVSRKKR